MDGVKVSLRGAGRSIREIRATTCALQQFAEVESEEFPYAATSYRLTEHFHVGDANIETPEYKAFLVNIELINEPVA